MSHWLWFVLTSRQRRIHRSADSSRKRTSGKLIPNIGSPRHCGNCWILNAVWKKKLLLHSNYFVLPYHEMLLSHSCTSVYFDIATYPLRHQCKTNIVKYMSKHIGMSDRNCAGMRRQNAHIIRGWPKVFEFYYSPCIYKTQKCKQPFFGCCCCCRRMWTQTVYRYSVLNPEAILHSNRGREKER